MITLVTTWRADEPLREKFMLSLSQFWDDNIRRVLFSQGTDDPLDERWLVIPFSGVGNMQAYLNKLQWPFMRGEDETIEPHTRIRLNAKFVFKCYLWFIVDVGKVFWVDSDIITHEPVTEEWLDGLLPDDKLCCYLGRDNMVSETGFVGFNTQHPAYRDYKESFLSFLNEGLNLSLEDWTDQGAFDAIRMCYAQELFHNLGEGVKHKGHVFVNSVLGSKMDHLKGPRKKYGHSLPSDLVEEHPEPYWQDIKK